MDVPTFEHYSTVHALEEYIALLQRLMMQADLDQADFTPFRKQSNELRFIINSLIAHDDTVVKRALELRDEYYWITK